MTLGEDLDKQLSRVRKLLALAGRQTGNDGASNAHEGALAAQRVVEYLDAHPLPLRWLVRKGSTVRVVPLAALASQSAAKAQLRVIQATRKDDWFFEAHRVKNDQAANALRLGYLYFERHSFCVLVRAGDVDAFL